MRGLIEPGTRRAQWMPRVGLVVLLVGATLRPNMEAQDASNPKCGNGCRSGDRSGRVYRHCYGKFGGVMQWLFVLLCPEWQTDQPEGYLHERRENLRLQQEPAGVSRVRCQGGREKIAEQCAESAPPIQIS